MISSDSPKRIDRAHLIGLYCAVVFISHSRESCPRAEAASIVRESAPADSVTPAHEHLLLGRCRCATLHVQLQSVVDQKSMISQSESSDYLTSISFVSLDSLTDLSAQAVACHAKLPEVADLDILDLRSRQ
jgi:hypothetical protein